MPVSCECCLLSSRGLCVGLITRPEEPTECGVFDVCDREASITRRPWPTRGFCAMGKIVSDDARVICLAPDTFQRQVLVNTVKEFLVQ
jgi:hypothetical protein